MSSCDDEARLPVFGAADPHDSDSLDDEDELPKQKSKKILPRLSNGIGAIMAEDATKMQIHNITHCVQVR